MEVNRVRVDFMLTLTLLSIKLIQVFCILCKESETPGRTEAQRRIICNVLFFSHT